MSNPAKSAEEIEDVLASIRRLVSGPVAGQDKPVPQSHDDRAAERLVLTPALRVTEPDDPWATVAPTADTAPDATPPAEHSDPSWGLEDRLADWGEISDSAAEAVMDAIAEGHGDTLSDQALEAPMIRFSARRPQPVLPEFEPETGDANWPDAGADSALRELVMVRGQGASDAEVAEPAKEAAPNHGCAPLHPVAETKPQPDMLEAPHMSTAKPMPETAPAEDEHLWAEDPQETPEAEPMAFEGQDTFADPMQDAEDMIEDLGEAASPFSFPDAEDGILDEETLREIVAEVVRQELQGALGQRITRNVRKMVRREIRLALAAEELE